MIYSAAISFKLYLCLLGIIHWPLKWPPLVSFPGAAWTPKQTNNTSWLSWATAVFLDLIKVCQRYLLETAAAQVVKVLIPTWPALSPDHVMVHSLRNSKMPTLVQFWPLPFERPKAPFHVLGFCGCTHKVQYQKSTFRRTKRILWK